MISCSKPQIGDSRPIVLHCISVKRLGSNKFRRGLYKSRPIKTNQDSCGRELKPILLVSSVKDG